MSEYAFKQVDFEHPSFFFALEDKLKGLIGGALLYNPYFRSFNLRGDEKVMDFGCGGGAGSRCLAALLNNGGQLTCIDASHYWIDKAVKRLNKNSNVECIAGDIRKLDMPDSSFDIISVLHVIHDIAPAERRDVVNTLSRRLKTDGMMYIREPIKISHGMPVEEIRTLLSAAGLKELEHEQTKSEYRGKYRKIN
jgi:ubiquinone/menaquinone biosynthesis C-methylase UbiE